VSVLTPPGTGAIATVAVAGPRAWELARRLFRPAGTKPLPEAPELHRFWFGTLGEAAGDEVILAVKQTEPEPVIEVHCHGGRRVVPWVVEQFTGERRGVSPIWRASGRHPDVPGESTSALRLDERQLTLAPTLRTAAVLLDQYHGAFDRAVRTIVTKLDAGETALPELPELASFAAVGRHLVEAWRVVIAGPPNVGKSSLVNALAGYQRSVVSEVAGTTRDVVTVPVAFDGWPVELADTAGLRDAAGLEAEGVDRARRSVAAGDVCVWVMDATAPACVFPDEETEQVVNLPTHQWVRVVNKTDQPATWNLDLALGAIHVSATTGDGIPGLAAEVARRLVPNPPPAGAAVPFTPHLADLVEAAHRALKENRPADAVHLLRDAVPHA
jgi:tRNA modification GTPase